MSTSAMTEADEGSAHPEPGAVIAGKYRVDKLVGRGGMGVVVAAQHVALGQTVAIKLLAVGGLDDARKREACARFLREGQSAARLTSDHVVRIYDVGTMDSGAPFMVMELLRGEDLATLLERQGPAPVEVAVEYVVQACDAVAEAHATGIVHRDLKPSNLFVSKRSDGRALVKVLDFGISKAIVPGSDAFEGNLTATRSVVGSPYYMSPEQVRDAKRVDARTDVWSLGMILYELMTGEPAFNADTLPGICAAIAADTPTPIRERRPDVPPEIEAIVMRCLEKDPAKRFQTITELVKALNPYVPHSPASSSLYASRAALPVDSLDHPRVSPDAATIGLLSDSGPRLADAAPLASRSPVEPAPNTMASSPGAAVPAPSSRSSETGRRSSRRPAESTSTLLSSSGSTVNQPAGSRRSVVVATGAALVLGAAGLIGILTRHASDPTPVASSVPAQVDRFTMTVDSLPSGAHVFDGDQILGTTPFTTVLDNKVVSVSPRKLTLRLDGYEPFDVVQGPSESNVRTAAKLMPVREPPSAAVEAPPASSPAARLAPRLTRPAPAKAPPRPSATAHATAAPGDIRLER